MTAGARHPRTLRPRGHATRAALLDALGAALEAGPWREVTVPRLAAGAGLAPATFYCYWPDLDAAAIDLAHRYREAGERIPGHLLALYRLLHCEAAMAGAEAAR